MQSTEQDATIGWLRAENHWLRQEVRILAEELRLVGCATESLKALAYLDSLTGLPNRRSLDATLKQRISVSAAHPFALLFLDLDDFKRINDSFGHSAADALLRDIAAALDGLTRSNDTLIPYGLATERSEEFVLSRLGGDEFVILLPGVKSRAAAGSVARRILNRFEERFAIERRSVLVTASIGIAIYPSDGETADALIQNADLAMYDAKQNGKARYEFCRIEGGLRLSANTAAEAPCTNGEGRLECRFS